MSDAAAGQWKPCGRCGVAIEAAQWRTTLHVCPNCGFHRRIAVSERIRQVVDPESFAERDAGLSAQDPLHWQVDGENYPDIVAKAKQSSKSPESFRYGAAKIGGNAAMVGGFEFNFLGGTLGSVAGEKVARTLEASIAENCPAVIFTASGGARMQEGMISLMQMAKIASAVATLNEARVPLVTVICDPTTGGVAASLAFMGDVVLAEPGALTGFAGPRVVLQTIGEEMPAGIQTSDRLCRDGFVDEIVQRADLRERLIARLQSLC